MWANFLGPSDMQANRHKYFRWTARTGWLTFAYVVAFPAFIGYLGIVTDVSSLERHERRCWGRGLARFEAEKSSGH